MRCVPAVIFRLGRDARAFSRDSSRLRSDSGTSVTAFYMRLSPQCVHSWPLDLQMLAEKLGPDFNIPENHAALMRKLVPPSKNMGTRP